MKKKPAGYIPIDPETVLCGLLSGYARELSEGKPFLETTLKHAKIIDKILKKQNHHVKVN